MGVSYRKALMNALVAAFREMLEQHGSSQVSSLQIGIEYPMQKAMYPYCMLDFDESSIENSAAAGDAISAADRALRWTFSGDVVFSVYSLSAAERDAMIDEMIGLVGMEKRFREMLLRSDINPYIALQIGCDHIAPRGAAASIGTPWGTDEVVYYASYALSATGEFLTTLSTPLEMIERIESYIGTDGIASLRTVFDVVLSGTEPVALDVDGEILFGSDLVVDAADPDIVFERGSDYAIDYDAKTIARIADGAIADGAAVSVSVEYAERRIPYGSGGWV